MLLAITVLFVLTVQFQIPPGNFKRGFLEKERRAAQFISLPGYSCEKIVSISQQGIFITTKHPDKLVAIRGKEIKELLVNEPLFFNAPLGNFKETGNANAIYIFKINSDSFLIVTPQQHSFVAHRCPPLAFTRCSVLDSNFFVFRKYDYSKRDQLFSTLSFPGRRTDETKLTAFHHDWGMSTDGTLLYNPFLKRFIYAFFYRPKAILFDSSLRLHDSLDLLGLSSQNISVIDVSTNTSEHFTTTRDPLVVCNKHACAYKNYLLIHSAVRGSNERLGLFNKTETLDLYDLIRLKYLGSFHIPRYSANEIRDIQIFDDTLYVLYQNRLGRFAMPYLKPGY